MMKKRRVEESWDRYCGRWGVSLIGVGSCGR